jgi:hypothetical protein
LPTICNASPEQVHGGSVTPLSDIYSLGVVLYELLAGVLPYRRDNPNAPAASHVFSTAPIVLPSAAAKDRAISRQLSGDLDSIVMRSLEHEPARRHFAGEPVHARPQTSGYLAANRGKVTALFAALLAFAVGLSVSLHKNRIADIRMQQIQTQSKLDANITSRDASVDVYRSVIKQQEGDALAAAGKFAAATPVYLESLTEAESCMKLEQAACFLIYMQSSRRLAQNSIALGHRDQAMEFAQQALHAGQGFSAGTASATAMPRAFSAMGFTYVALDSSPLRATGDQEQAKLWLDKSLSAWRAAQSDSGFSEDDRLEMKEVEGALSRIAH